MPSVIVGIVTRDRENFLPKSVRSALSQRGISVRVSVIDDGSRDGTPLLAQCFPGVEWITWPESRGYLVARNYWIIVAKAEYFIGLDDDAWFEEHDAVEKAGLAMDANPRIGAIAFDILSPDRPERRTRSGSERVSSFIGCGHMLRLSAVKEVGGYEVAPGAYGAEEKDLCLRLIDAGYQIMRLPGVHVWHDKSAVARDAPDQYRSLVCNDLMLTFRRAPTVLLPLAFMVKCYQHFNFALRKGLFQPCLEGFQLFLRNLAEAKGSRRPVKFSTLRNYMRLARTT